MRQYEFERGVICHVALKNFLHDVYRGSVPQPTS
jgi:hypothetical protein